MKKLLIIFGLLLGHSAVYSQKNCGKANPGLIPLNEAGNWNYRGYTGGLYGQGKNYRSGSHLSDGLAFASQVAPRDTAGNLSSNGKIVMIGVGASNPRTEFDAFMRFADTFQNINPKLFFVNTCIGGQGIQKMKDLSDNYWKSAAKEMDSLGVGFRQVQAAWIETDNTADGDTVFPRAALSLTDEYRELLQTLKALYPNLKICYFAGRAYSGWAEPQQGGVGKGLLAPRDYYQGWATRFLIEKQISREAGFISSGTGAVIPFSTWANYSYTDGSKTRSDGFSVDCNTDIGADGLHLTGAGEMKIGEQMFRYFQTDTTSKGWFLNQPASSTRPVRGVQILAYPNPADVLLHVNSGQAGVFQWQLIHHSGKTVLSGSSGQQETLVSISEMPSGVYYLKTEFPSGESGISKVIIAH